MSLSGHDCPRPHPPPSAAGLALACVSCLLSWFLLGCLPLATQTPQGPRGGNKTPGAKGCGLAPLADPGPVRATPPRAPDPRRSRGPQRRPSGGKRAPPCRGRCLLLLCRPARPSCRAPSPVPTPWGPSAPACRRAVLQGDAQLWSLPPSSEGAERTGGSPGAHTGKADGKRGRRQGPRESPLETGRWGFAATRGQQRPVVPP